MFDVGRFTLALQIGLGGHEEQALEELRKLLPETDDNENRAWIVLYEALFLARLRRNPEAEGRLQDLLKIWEDTPEHRARMGFVDAVLEEANYKPERALKKLDYLLNEYRVLWAQEDVRDLYEEIQFGRGRLLATAENYRLALPVLEESLGFNRPKANEFYYNLGFCYFQAERWDEAEKSLQAALSGELIPEISSAAHYYLGRIFYLRGAFRKAMKEFETALRDAKAAETPRAGIYDALAKSCQRLGLHNQSEQYRDLARASEAEGRVQ